MAEVFGSEGMKNLHLRGVLVLTGPEVEAAVLAVKNHDRLTEENKLLRDLLKGVVIEFDSQHLDADAYGLMCGIKKELGGE
ncbi:hypothetical protein [Vibrio cholerae]|uniref:hypothetical protein n=1 Tax=Vibrio cholerae TaxID=666 RepID=UPI0029346701|nr:hypothetical protein [Vibrio cholerae]MDV2299657.1 hypothetical protein [Vibrio cholerae]